MDPEEPRKPEVQPISSVPSIHSIPSIPSIPPGQGQVHVLGAGGKLVLPIKVLATASSNPTAFSPPLNRSGSPRSIVLTRMVPGPLSAASSTGVTGSTGPSGATMQVHSTTSAAHALLKLTPQQLEGKKIALATRLPYKPGSTLAVIRPGSATATKMLQFQATKLSTLPTDPGPNILRATTAKVLPLSASTTVPTAKESSGPAILTRRKASVGVKCDTFCKESDEAEGGVALSLGLSSDMLRPILQRDNSEEKENKVEDFKIPLGLNEFGALEVSPEVEEDLDLTCKEETPDSPEKDKLVLAQEEAAPAKPKLNPDELLHCQGCGMYGLAGEFMDRESCSAECRARVRQRLKDKEKRERELLIQKQRREAKKREKLLQVERQKHLEEQERQLVYEQEEAKIESEDDFEESLMFREREIESEEEELEYPEEEEEEHFRVKPPTCSFNRRYPWYDSKRGVSWTRYLEYTRSKAAPTKLFEKPIPRSVTVLFAPRMRLEAIDPEHPALFCVVSVAQVQGCRIRLHFDGYPDAYDFWENIDSANIFPAGWCRTKGQVLQPPKNYSMQTFEWSTYIESLSSEEDIVAPRDCFPPRPLLPDITGTWNLGMKLEAVDKHNASLVCVASVANVLDGRILIHFDGWEIDYDYWVIPSTSPYVHPVGWCQRHGFDLIPPKTGQTPGVPFSWHSYLNDTMTKAVPPSAFKPAQVRELSLFKPNMKLEAVDRRNHMHVRVATVVDVIGRQLKIHFDGWPHEYDLWYEDDSPSLHPMTWAAKTGHPLMPPLTPEEVSYFAQRTFRCPTPGCRGSGRVRGHWSATHNTPSHCPYAPQNMSVDGQQLPDRLRGPSEGEYSLTDLDEEQSNMEEEEMGEDRSRPFFSTLSSGPKDLGRGNRKRKKRKFFDDEHGGNQGKFSLMQQAFSSDDTAYRSVAKGRMEAPERGVRTSVFRPGYHPDPYSESSAPGWKENSAFLRLQLNGLTNVRLWHPEQVADMVCRLVPQFDAETEQRVRLRIASQEIDGEALLMLTQADLVQALGLKLGPAIKIYHSILLLKEKES